MSKFFRFLSFRGGKPPGGHSNKSNLCSIKDHSILSTHSKLREGCEENLKESIEHYNQRCLAAKQLKEQDEIYRLEEEKPNNGDQPINSKFLSFKSKNKSKTSKMRVTKNGQIIPKDSIECAVFFLDQTEESFFIPKKCLADKLYEQVFYHLDLIETDYFGLQFSDSHNVQHWLDPTKLIKKQCKIGPPYQFFFRVKFYTVEPNNLKEELTRYFYFLQLKNDLRSGRLQCQQESIAVELCALVLQEELGDYDPHSHSIDTISEFRFLPEVQQTEDLENQIFDKYSSTNYKAMSPAESELMFLNKAKWLEMYGVDMHCVYGRDGNEYKLGLTPSGILVFEEEPIPNSSHFNNNKIGLFYWPKIEKVTFSKKKFTILVGEDDNRGFKQEHVFIFNLIDEKACKHLWKCAVEYHSFFRLKTSLMTNNFGMVGSNGGGLINGFIRRGSRFRGPQRTEYQTHNMTRLTTPRRSVQFERRPSQRFSRRASYAAKRTQRQLPTTTSECTNGELINITEDTVKSKSEPQAPIAAARSSKQSPKLDKKIGTTITKASSVGHCCKMQMSNNGGEKHDEKCNLFKAKQMKLKQKENEANKLSPKVIRSPTKMVEIPTSTAKSKNLCTTANNFPDDVIQPLAKCSINELTENNLLDDESDLGRRKENNKTNKLVDKVNIFESLDLNNQSVTAQPVDENNLETSHSSTTDQPLINLNESNHEPAPTISRKDSRTAMNLDIQNILEQPGTSIQRFQDLKMTEI